MSRGAWQLDIRDFAEVAMKGDRQAIGKVKPAPYAGLVFVFVALHDYGTDQFFVVDWISLRDLLVADYTAYLARHRGV